MKGDALFRLLQLFQKVLVIIHVLVTMLSGMETKTQDFVVEQTNFWFILFALVVDTGLIFQYTGKALSSKLRTQSVVRREKFRNDLNTDMDLIKGSARQVCSLTS